MPLNNSESKLTSSSSRSTPSSNSLRSFSLKSICYDDFRETFGWGTTGITSCLLSSSDFLLLSFFKKLSRVFCFLCDFYTLLLSSSGFGCCMPSLQSNSISPTYVSLMFILVLKPSMTSVVTRALLLIIWKSLWFINCRLNPTKYTCSSIFDPRKGCAVCNT